MMTTDSRAGAAMATRRASVRECAYSEEMSDFFPAKARRWCKVVERL